jgi:hypothetical protein
MATLLTYLLEQSPSWETNRFLARQEIPRIVLKPKVHHRIQNCSPPVSILSQPNPFHTPTSHFLKMHPNIILLYTPGSPQWSLSLSFPHQNPIQASLLPHPRYFTQPKLVVTFTIATMNVVYWCAVFLSLRIPEAQQGCYNLKLQMTSLQWLYIMWGP